MSSERRPIPLACTLTADEHAGRIRWIQELNAGALSGYHRDGSLLRLVYHPAAAPTVREFVRRERQCCPFLDFTIEERQDALVVTIEAPTGLGATADALFAAYPRGRRR
ncbi:hypothetical protein A5672_09420 [Mycobacterium alsense]|uniref:Uncharacterized protein n=1 Tax=Mycobacterium alsense TaxID=324058 RepID=A0ABD6P511_9MYCO|nr:hypothetical protein [Mycobacterium alsense]OBG45176.1 hypothetical protein A5672_09420 [Mycobacterium alsense]OBI96008.1 hypothetical protein A5660_08910 [Mycobacterium alsense]